MRTKSNSLTLWGSKGQQRQGNIGSSKKTTTHGEGKGLPLPFPPRPSRRRIKILFGHVQYVCKNVSKHLLVECTPCFIGNMSCSKSKILRKMENLIVNRFKKAARGRPTEKARHICLNFELTKYVYIIFISISMMDKIHHENASSQIHSVPSPIMTMRHLNSYFKLQ